MGECSFQPLAKSKGVVGDCESEACQPQAGKFKAKPWTEEHEQYKAYLTWISLPNKMKSNNYTGSQGVNNAVRWGERY